MRSEAIADKSDINGGVVAKVQQRNRKKREARLDRRTKCSRRGKERGETRQKQIC